MPDTADILPAILGLVLEGTSGNMATMAYYHRAAQHARDRDPNLVALVADLVAWVTDRYRSARQFEYHAERVPVTKQVDRRVRATLQSDCAICLRPLKAPGQHVVRLRPASDQPDECGHFFHRDCIGEWELRQLTAHQKSCPLCRADLGATVRLWDDHESHKPLF